MFPCHQSDISFTAPFHTPWSNSELRKSIPFIHSIQKSTHRVHPVMVRLPSSVDHSSRLHDRKARSLSQVSFPLHPIPDHHSHMQLLFFLVIKSDWKTDRMRRKHSISMSPLQCRDGDSVNIPIFIYPYPVHLIHPPSQLPTLPSAMEDAHTTILSLDDELNDSASNAFFAMMVTAVRTTFFLPSSSPPQ